VARRQAQEAYDLDKTPPSSLEKAYERLFETMAAIANYLIDYHNAWTNSISFAFRDRLLYRAIRMETSTRPRQSPVGQAGRDGQGLRPYIITDFLLKST